MSSGISSLKQLKMWKSALWIAIFFAMFIMIVYPEMTLAVPIDNPISSNTFNDLVTKLADEVVKIAFIAAPIFIIFAGFRFLTSSLSGNTGGVANARKILWWTLVGTAIVVGASLLAKAVINTVKNL